MLMREAGGMVGDLAGRTDQRQDIVCANEHLQPQLLKLLNAGEAKTSPATKSGICRQVVTPAKLSCRPNSGDNDAIFPCRYYGESFRPGPPASAAVQTGDEIWVNPVQAGRKRNAALSGRPIYARDAPLLQPGETGPVQLHMPTKSAARASSQRTASVAPDRETRPAPVPRAPKRVAVAAPPPASAPSNNGYNSGYGAFGAPQGAAGMDLVPSHPSAPVPAPPPPSRQVAKAAPPAARLPGPPPGLTRRSAILFAADASEPAQAALGAIKFLASDLTAAMTHAASRMS